MKLIIGLGNPGPKYKKTWHNVGFMAMENLQKNWELEKFKKQAKFQSEIASGKIKTEKIILAKPQIMMNNSGLAATALANYYKITPEDVIVVRDDIDLPLGKIRIVRDSSAGGHNGVKSIIRQLGSQKFIQIKIGVKTELMKKINAADYVLAKIGKKEEKNIKEIIKKTALAIEAVIVSSVEKAMNLFN